MEGSKGVAGAQAVAVDANRDDHRDRDDAPDTGLDMDFPRRWLREPPA
jgi:hypothetical protein